MKNNKLILLLMVIFALLIIPGAIYADDDEEEVLAAAEYGTSLGESLGKTLGFEDFQAGEDSDWNDARPSNSDISEMYGLDKLSNDDEDDFIDAFKDAFEAGYENAYAEALLDPPKMSMEQGLNDGEAAGMAMGAISAEKDYLYKSSMNDQRDLLSDSEIRELFRLGLESGNYDDAFIQSFKIAYTTAYNERFRALSQKDSLIKSVSTTIIPEGGDFESAGVKVSVEPGTFYMPTMLTLNTRNTDYYTSGTLNRASEVYGIMFDNVAGSLNDNKPITISFPYYGVHNKAGIYKMVGGKWTYLPSRIEDDIITTELLPSTLSNIEGVFAVFMDINTRVLTDITYHWAKEEIETMVRRNIITGYPGTTYLDGTFAPEQAVTRAEFLILLSRVQNWTLSSNYYTNASYFTDYSEFESYGNIISYALSKKYIYGYPDITFRPNNSISYYEVGMIMSRVLSQADFTWNTIAEQMMYDKGYKSPSFQNMNGKITRAEVAYMLYVLNEWRY